MQRKVLESINQLIESQAIMTLATVSMGQPFSCAVFYVYRPDNRAVLYFKSRTGSLHIKALQENPLMGGSIYRHESTYVAKAGVQFIAQGDRVKNREEMDIAVELYCERFEGAAVRMPSIARLLAHDAESTLFRCCLRKIKFVDSSQGFLVDAYEEYEP